MPISRKSMFSLAMVFGAGTVLAVIAMNPLHGEDDGAQDPSITTNMSDDTAKGEVPADVMKDGSYALGVRIGNDIIGQRMPIDREAFLEGLTAVMNEQELRLSEEELTLAMMDFHNHAMEVMRQQRDELKDKGVLLLETNKEREEVTVTESGLQYEVLQEGEGENPQATDWVTVHYEGTHVDGRVFDSSYERGEPSSFPLNRVIAGWTEGLQLMKPGAKYRFWIPSELAYGKSGKAPSIEPNEMLMFDVELISIGMPGQ